MSFDSYLVVKINQNQDKLNELNEEQQIEIRKGIMFLTLGRILIVCLGLVVFAMLMINIIANVLSDEPKCEVDGRKVRCGLEAIKLLMEEQARNNSNSAPVIHNITNIGDNYGR